MSAITNPVLPDPPGQLGLSEAEKELAWEEHSYARAKKRDEAAVARMEAEARKIAQTDEKAGDKSSFSVFWAWRK
jgi:hypothetical protein